MVFFVEVGRSTGPSDQKVAFTNGDRVRIEGAEAVHCTSGLRAPLLQPSSQSLDGQRCTLRGVAELADALVDLEHDGEPSCAGVMFRNFLVGPAEQVAMLAPKLPTDLSAPSRMARRKLFKGMDGNGNGYLSLAEVDRGVRASIGSDALFDAKPAIMRAFQVS